jgi:hypothetical protein
MSFNWRLLYKVESWALAGLGVLHMGATFRFFNALTSQALWFFCGGVLMVLTAALNLVNRTYGSNARGLRIVSAAANLVITAIAVASGIVSHAGPIEWVVVLGIVVPLTVLSLSDHPFRLDRKNP